MAQQPPVSQGLIIIEASRSHSETPQLAGLLWTIDQPTQRPLPDNTQHLEETDIHDPSGIRTHNHRKREATDPLLRPRVYCDRLTMPITQPKCELWSRNKLAVLY